MQPQKQVVAFLDADSVGPVPRVGGADESDAFSMAKTLRLPPRLGPTLDLGPQDVIEVFDLVRPRLSIANLGRVDLARVPSEPAKVRGGQTYAAIALAVAGLAVGMAIVRSLTYRAESPAVVASEPAVAVAPAEPPPLAAAATAAPLPPRPSTSNIGTLRVDPQAEGHRVWVDGTMLTAQAAILQCGTHRVRVGSFGHPRAIDVPCGGEITVYR
jgi:hypothetical protein